MGEQGEWLAAQFERKRSHLRAVAYRMLGSLGEADDAVQEAWLRLSRSDANSIENLGGWLTTVVARVCLDALRSRSSRHEESLDDSAAPALQQASHRSAASDPEQEFLMADSVGLALLVVLEKLTPAERLAFVLHDTFDLSFDEIAVIIGRTPEATRQLASRARRRVRGTADVVNSEVAAQRKIADAFLAALRAADFEALVALLDPDLVVKADLGALPPGTAELRGAEPWARYVMRSAQGAKAARVALVDGEVGVVIAPRGRLFRVLRFTFAGGKIAQIDVVADAARLQALDLAAFDGK
jgi:RNA polymerase sigma-70 factor, ECF subfamily